MLTLLFLIGMFWVFGKMIFFAIRATWGLTKVLFSIVLLPLVLVGLVIGGFIYIAFPLLIIVGIVSMITNKI